MSWLPIPSRLAAVLLAFAALTPPLFAAESLALKLEDAEIFIERLPGGADRLLWLPSEYGFQGAPERLIAEELAVSGLEVWLANLHDSYFLAPGASSLEQIPVESYAALIQAARPKTGRLYLLTSDRGARPTLQALRRIQAGGENAEPLGGLILLHPNLTATPPLSGEPARYFPVTRATNLPIYLMQPLSSARRWYLADLIRALEHGGSDVYLHPLPEVSDGFQARPDATPYELEVRAELPGMLARATELLNPYNRRPRTPPPLGAEADAGAGAAAQAAGLQPYTGDPTPPPLAALDLKGREHRLEDYRGRVILLNFWATWCPPCVEEIPSMGRLQAGFDEQDFVILGVDIGEDAATVEAFLNQVPAAFPVLLDPAGTLVAPWKIRAFPTSFLLDREGRIRYGYYGALEWDNPAVETLVQGLAEE